MKNIKVKVGIAIILDLIAIGVIGYIATQTMSLLLWVFLLLVGMIFAYDVSKAMLFLSELFGRK